MWRVGSPQQRPGLGAAAVSSLSKSILGFHRDPGATSDRCGPLGAAVVCVQMYSLLFLLLDPSCLHSSHLKTLSSCSRYWLRRPAGFGCLERISSCTVGHSSAEKVKTSTSQRAGSCGFCLHRVWASFFSVGTFFFPCLSYSNPAPQQASIYCVCTRVHTHAGMTTSSFSPLMFLGALPLLQRNKQFLQHPTVCFHFKGRRD